MRNCAAASWLVKIALVPHTAHRNLGIGTPPQSMAPQAVAHHWRNSVFRLALEQFDEAWIDPEAMGGAALVMSRERLTAAAARVQERLAPRIPELFTEP